MGNITSKRCTYEGSFAKSAARTRHASIANAKGIIIDRGKTIVIPMMTIWMKKARVEM